MLKYIYRGIMRKNKLSIFSVIFMLATIVTGTPAQAEASRQPTLGQEVAADMIMLHGRSTIQIQHRKMSRPRIQK